MLVLVLTEAEESCGCTQTTVDPVTRPTLPLPVVVVLAVELCYAVPMDDSNGEGKSLMIRPVVLRRWKVAVARRLPVRTRRALVLPPVAMLS